MSRKIQPHRDSQHRPLRVEHLEDRSLLAVAAFTIELREDNGGVPGDVIAADEVEVGDCFFAEIRAQEFHPLYKGLHGVALNIAWDPSVLEEIDVGFDLAQIITDNLPLFRGGSLDNAAGTIDNLSGSAFHASGIGRSIGDGAPERFALLHFRAESATAATSIRLSEGASSIVTQPAATFASSQLSFEEQTIAIVAAAAAEALVEPPPPDAQEPELPPPEPVATDRPADDETATDEPIEADPAIYLLTSFERPAIIEDPLDTPTADDVVPIDDVPLPPEPEIVAEINTLSSENAAPEETDDCPAGPSFAAAVDVVLMGPLTPEQFAAQPANTIFRLQDLIALLALDVAERRRVATVINQNCE